ncbi:hypothetical protein Tco_1493931 [Tanacetum coccineum]
MSMTIQSSVKDKILATPSETSKGMMRTVVMDEAHASRSPVIWAEMGGSSLIGPKLVLVKERPKAARDRVLLKVTPWKGVVHFGKKASQVDG